MRFITPAIVALLCLSGTFLRAQTVTLSLDQAKQSALANNLSIVQADANMNAAQAGVTAAYGGYLPSLSAVGSWGRTQTDRAGSSVASFGGGTVVIPASKSTTSSFSSSLNLSWTLFDGFAQQGQVGQASSRSVASELTAVRTRQTIVFQVESGYLNVLRNEQLVKVSEEALKRDQRQLERITESNRVGSSSLADVYRQQSQVAGDELALIQAQNNFDKSKADLVALVGLDAWKEYVFVDPTISTVMSPGEIDSTMSKYSDFSALVERAMAARPDYKGAQESYNAAQSGVTIARAGYMPSVSASAGYRLLSDELRTLSNNKTLDWGLSVRWNLFDGFQTNNAVQSAVTGRRNAEISLTQAERDINTQVKKALLDLEAARKQYDVSQKGLVSAREDLKIAEERYNLGAGTLLDLLVANANFVSAQANSVNAVYDYVTAKRNVEYTIGERTY
ncbi:MAG: TolC family protein [Bacteroidota bacterium]